MVAVLSELLSQCHVRQDGGVMIVETPLQDRLVTSVGGEQFRRDLKTQSYLLAHHLLGEMDMGENPVVIGIPRGGIPAARGVEMVLNGRGIPSCYMLSNAGEDSDPSAPLLPQNLSGATGVVIVDGIIGSGQSVIKHVEAIRESGFNGPIGLVAPIAATYGLDNIQQSLPDANLAIVSGQLFPGEACQWMQFDPSRPAVYVVGVFEGNIKIGDYGSMVANGMPATALQLWSA